MRRTQNAFTYASMIVTLLAGLLFMVGVLTHDGFASFVNTIVFGIAASNLQLLGGFGSIVVLLTMYLLLRWQKTV